MAAKCHPLVEAALGSLVVLTLACVAAASPGRGGSCTLCHDEPGGVFTPSPNPLIIAPNHSALLTFTITSLGGSDKTNLSVQGLENMALAASIAPGGNPWTLRTHATYGRSYVSNTITSTGPYTLNLAIGSNATLGSYPIVVMYAGNGATGTESNFLLQIGRTLAAADFDEDGDVDGDDLTRWRSGVGVTGTATHLQGDANSDLNVDGADFLVWQRQVGSVGSLVAAIAAPEPATGSLILAAAAAMAMSVRRVGCGRRADADESRSGPVADESKPDHF
jgi:hypothetical protein